MGLDAELVRQLTDRLDQQTVYLQKIAALLETGGYGGGLQIEQQGVGFNAQDLLLAMALPSSPARTREVTINAVTPTQLAINESQPLIRVDVTNDDPAQMCWLGDRAVLPSMGRVLTAQNTIPYVLLKGREVYAICAVATISMRISEGYDLIGILRQLAGIRAGG